MATTNVLPPQPLCMAVSIHTHTLFTSCVCKYADSTFELLEYIVVHQVDSYYVQLRH